ncbi:helix-turn-helix transcriptional regulator [Hydrogenophaga defluvii]|uniref:Helix-turn-helix transcriptional regulator n=1 Tax=Hydrogenophaga defluvii TaxID=249410 RepID=A0ABW2S777_9BURK
MKTLATLKTELLADTKTRQAYDALADEFEIARQLIEVRARARMTQGEVAEKMGTTQSVVARLESGKRPPSLRTVQRYAEAVGGRVVVRIEPASDAHRRLRARAAST